MQIVRDNFGKGQCFELQYDSGTAYQIALYDELPFVCIKTLFHNPGDTTVTIAKYSPLSLKVNLDTHQSQLRVLGCDGLTAADRERISYTFLSIANPKTNAGVVCGWLTNDRASGIVTCTPEKSVLNIEPRSEYGKLLIEPGQNAVGETFAIGYFDNALSGLEAYADAIARNYNIKLPQTPAGYCTWYSKPNGGASDEKHMAEFADFCEKNLKQFGFEVLQIDDKWQISGRDFTDHKPKGPYPSGMKKTAEKITSSGFTPGIWLIPFGWDHTRDIFKEHQDWFVHKDDGSPYEVHWAGTCMDMTHPQAKAFLSDVLARMAHEWGYKYLKIDGLWTGMAVKILYPEPTYRDDNLGDAVFHNPAKTNIEAYRDGLKLLREASGSDVYVLGCNIAQNMRTLGASMGLVDGMRVGRDIGADWKRILRCADMGARLYFFHSRVWHNDPDCLMLREPLTLEQAQAWGSWIGISGQLNLVSEWLPGLPVDRLEIVKRTMPNHGLCARPIDLFESDLAKVWHLKTGEGEHRQDVVGLFNWSNDKADSIRVDLKKLDLQATYKGYIGFDYWANRFVGPVNDAIEAKLQAGSCAVISVRPMLDRPVLVSTSRHVTQGIVDVSEVKWDGAKQVLEGKSRVVGGDSYELRIFAPDESWQVNNAVYPDSDGQAGIKAKIQQSGREVRVILESSTNRGIEWKVSFKKG